MSLLASQNTDPGSPRVPYLNTQINIRALVSYQRKDDSVIVPKAIAETKSANLVAIERLRMTAVESNWAGMAAENILPGLFGIFYICLRYVLRDCLDASQTMRC